MANLGLEIVFWVILLTYLGARLTQTSKGFKQNYWIKFFIIKSWKLYKHRHKNSIDYLKKLLNTPDRIARKEIKIEKICIFVFTLI